MNRRFTKITKRSLCLLALLLGSCSQAGGAEATIRLDGSSRSDSASTTDGNAPIDARVTLDAARPKDAALADSAEPTAPCTTRIHYGSTWIRPSGHNADYDDVQGLVGWDGTCPVDAAGNGVATLSNGWQPIFVGKSCVIAFEYMGTCQNAPAACDTRVSYGPTWLRPNNHPNDFDDVSGVVHASGQCSTSGAESYLELSNGWQPWFSGSSGCDISLRYRQCGALYTNPVLAENCPDPGVFKDGDTYIMSCTDGARGTYPIFTSKSLTSWQYVGTAFGSSGRPAWATQNFWAPEIHKVGSKYVLYFSALANSGTYAIGAATSESPTGPFKDLGTPLLTIPSPGAIDAHYFRQSSGEHYLLWKVDGNAVGQATPIRIQPLAADGLSLTGSPSSILSNTLDWEGPLVEGPFMIEENGYFYLFYSGNGYWTTEYGVSVARSTSPLGPFTKNGSKLLRSNSRWSGPGHGSIVRSPSGEWVHVYHAWVAGNVNASPGRLVLVDRIQWNDGWPALRASPSFLSQPRP